MLPFFRNIRRKLLEKTALRKYLLYALGEITLVVLGILIAIQVNNWNENRMDQARTNKFLTNLKSALEDDVRSLDATISFNRLRLNGVFYILRHSGLNTKTFTEMPWATQDNRDLKNPLWSKPYPDTLNREFTNLVFSMIGRGFGGAAFNKSVINELYSTGSFSNIQDPEIKSKINDYYRYLTQRLEGWSIQEHEEWANEVTRFLRDSYGIFTLDVADLEDPFALIRNKKDVEHHLRYLALEINYHSIWASQARSQALELISLIEQQEMEM